MIEQLVRVYIELKKLLILSNYHKINCLKEKQYCSEGGWIYIIVTGIADDN